MFILLFLLKFSQHRIHAFNGLFVDDRGLDFLYEQLPFINLLNITTNHHQTMTFNVFDTEQYQVNKLFKEWFTTKYHKVTSTSLGSVLYFLSVDSISTDKNWWRNLDSELMKLVSSPASRIQVDKIFMVLSNSVHNDQFVDQFNRNTLDIRMLKVDNDASTNGRDVFIPYKLTGQKLSKQNKYSDNKKRKLFFSCFCFEVDQLLENRHWRTMVYNQWKTVPGSLLINTKNDSKERLKHFKTFLTSDFCLIIPEVTSSSSDLFSAIFAGCIPVVFVSYRDQLPFIHYLNWSKFAIIVIKDIINSKTAMNELLTYLRRIRDDALLLTKYKMTLRKVAPLFDYTKTDWPSVYHLTLLELVHIDSRIKYKNNTTAKISPYLNDFVLM